MIAELKAKAESVDRKRIYTAVAALVIAGAAGHIMQRSAGDPDGSKVLSASVPGTQPAVSPGSDAPATSQIVAAGMLTPPAVPGPEQPEPTEAINLVTFTKGAQPLPPAPILKVGESVEATELAEMSGPAAAEAPPNVEEETALAVAGEAHDPAAAIMAEVTRSAADPILALPQDTEPKIGDVSGAGPIVSAPVNVVADETEAPVAATESCALMLEGVAEAGAMAALTLSAPCDAGAAVEFDHAGLRFSEQLGPEGDLFVVVPAMAETAVFTARIGDSQETSIELNVPDFARFERVALMWKGSTGLQLHALENGAAYGEPGHVWAEEPGSAESVITGKGGFVSVLGSTSEGYAADVYTYPNDLMTNGAEPRVSVETQVMENTCGTRIEGSILRSNAGRAPTLQPLTIAVPSCDAVGEYLVLNNLPQDLKLARN